MMAFQREPDPETRCDRCHETVAAVPKLTSESEPYCSRCGYVFGTSVQPAPWVCECCGDIVLHHGGDERPRCRECDMPLSCLTAQPSRVHGCGIGDKDLDLGYDLLMNAQEADLQLGSDILRDLLK